MNDFAAVICGHKFNSKCMSMSTHMHMHSMHMCMQLCAADKRMHMHVTHIILAHDQWNVHGIYLANK